MLTRLGPSAIADPPKIRLLGPLRYSPGNATMPPIRATFLDHGHIAKIGNRQPIHRVVSVSRTLDCTEGTSRLHCREEPTEEAPLRAAARTHAAANGFDSGRQRGCVLLSTQPIPVQVG